MSLLCSLFYIHTGSEDASTSWSCKLDPTMTVYSHMRKKQHRFVLFFVFTAAWYGCNELMKRRNTQNKKIRTSVSTINHLLSVWWLFISALESNRWKTQRITLSFSHSLALFALLQLPHFILSVPVLLEGNTPQEEPFWESGGVKQSPWNII